MGPAQGWESLGRLGRQARQPAENGPANCDQIPAARGPAGGAAAFGPGAPQKRTGSLPLATLEPRAQKAEHRARHRKVGFRPL